MSAAGEPLKVGGVTADFCCGHADRIELSPLRVQPVKTCASGECAELFSPFTDPAARSERQRCDELKKLEGCAGSGMFL
jgi:hypothetical protein